MRIESSVKDIKELEQILIGSLGLKRGVIIAHEAKKMVDLPNVGKTRFYVRRYRVALDPGKRVFQSRWVAITFEYDERCNRAIIHIPFGHLQDLLKRFPKMEMPVKDLRYQHYRRCTDAPHDDGQDQEGAAHIIDSCQGEPPKLQPESRPI